MIHVITAKEAELRLKGFLKFKETCNANQKFKKANCKQKFGYKIDTSRMTEEQIK